MLGTVEIWRSGTFPEKLQVMNVLLIANMKQKPDFTERHFEK